MRIRPPEFIVPLKVQWICAAVHAFLGESTLANVPALMSGFGSVLDRPGMEQFAAAAFALRQMGRSVGSDIQLRQAVHDAVIWEEDNRQEPHYVAPPFRIDPERPHYPFVLRGGAAALARRFADALINGLPFDTWSYEIADPARAMAVMEGAADGAERISLDLASLPPHASPPGAWAARPR